MLDVAGQLIVQKGRGIFTGKFEHSHLRQGYDYRCIARRDKFLGGIAEIVDSAVDNMGALYA